MCLAVAGTWQIGAPFSLFALPVVDGSLHPAAEVFAVVLALLLEVLLSNQGHLQDLLAKRRRL